MVFKRYRDLTHFWRSNLGQLIAFYMWKENLKLVHLALPLVSRMEIHDRYIQMLKTFSGMGAIRYCN